MKKQKDEKWLDKLISRTINEREPQFDAEKWKQKYPEEFQMLLSRVRQASPRQPNIWRTIFKSPITKLAAAAVIIIAIGFFAVYRRPDEQIDSHRIPEVAKSPAELMTLMSLNIAYRKGGIEAVEKQYNEAFKLLGPRPGNLSVKQILTEFNGT